MSPTPDVAPSPVDDHRPWRAILLAGVAYALIYLWFAPPIYTAMDESAYLNLAYAFRQGTPYLDVAGTTAPMTYTVHGGHLVTQYPPGMSAVLAAASLTGWNVALGVNLAAHLLGFALVAWLLRALKASPIFAVLYLCHPTAVIYSRTIMSDMLSATLTTLVVLLYIRERYLLTGMVIGAAVLVKTANGILLPLLAIAVFMEELQRYRGKSLPNTAVSATITPLEIRAAVRKLLLLVGGTLPLLALAWLYQATIQDGGWQKYSSIGFSITHLPSKLAFYGLALTLLYPGMLPALALYRGKGQYAFWLICGGTLLLYSGYYFQDAGASALESFIVGQRYILGILPLLIVTYGVGLSVLAQKLLPGRLWIPVVGGITLLLLGGSALIHARHDRYLRQMVAVRNAAIQAVPDDAVLVANVQVAKLLHPAWTGKRSVVQVGLTSNKPDYIARRVRQIAEEAVARAGKRPVYAVFWSRDYRGESESEQAFLSEMQARYSTRPITVRTGVQINGRFQVLKVGLKHSAPHAATKAVTFTQARRGFPAQRNRENEQ